MTTDAEIRAQLAYRNSIRAPAKLPLLDDRELEKLRASRRKRIFEAVFASERARFSHAWRSKPRRPFLQRRECRHRLNGPGVFQLEKGCGKVPIYTLGQVEPTLPDAGRFWLAPDAHIIGNVRLGTDVGIWFGAILRGDTELLVVGEGSNIQEGAMLHGFPLTIGRGVTVGHHAILHGCIIGANTLIGMGSTILNGARIGASCLIGANTLITEGMTARRRRCPAPRGRCSTCFSSNLIEGLLVGS